MLRVMVYEEGYFTLDNLNTRLENIEPGYMETKDRQTPLADKTLRSSSGVSLKQSGMYIIFEHNSYVLSFNRWHKIYEHGWTGSPSV